MHDSAALLNRPAWRFQIMCMALGRTPDHCARVDDDDDERQKEESTHGVSIQTDIAMV